MAAPAKRWLVPSAAFAAGITATIAVSALIFGSSLIATKGMVGFDAAQQASSDECASGSAGCVKTRDEKAAHASEKLFSKERAWSDPIRSVSSRGSSSQKQPTQLTFYPEAGDERNALDQTKPAGSPDRADHRLPAGRVDVTPALTAALSAETGQSTAEENPTAHANVNPPPGDNSLTEALKSRQARIGQAQPAPPQSAKVHDKAERTLAVLERSTVLRDRSRGFLNQAPPRTPMASNIAAKLAVSRSSSLAGDRPDRSNLTQPKDYPPQARRLDTRSQAALQAKSRPLQAEARESKTRLSSAGSGGVMSWLQEPSGRYY